MNDLPTSRVMRAVRVGTALNELDVAFSQEL